MFFIPLRVPSFWSGSAARWLSKWLRLLMEGRNTDNIEEQQQGTRLCNVKAGQQAMRISAIVVWSCLHIGSCWHFLTKSLHVHFTCTGVEYLDNHHTDELNQSCSYYLRNLSYRVIEYSSWTKLEFNLLLDFYFLQITGNSLLVSLSVVDSLMVTTQL